MSGISSITSSNTGILNGKGLIGSTSYQKENSEFQALLDSFSTKDTESSISIVENGKINGDYKSGFSGIFTSQNDKKALPTGAAANSKNISSQQKTIDKTSKLYEKSMELESYFVKIMLSSMRGTLSTSGLNGEKSYAQNMYEDMLYDELSVSLTKNAGFGLADQIYMELV